MVLIALTHLLNLRLCKVSPEYEPTHWAKSPAQDIDVSHLLNVHPFPFCHSSFSIPVAMILLKLSL